MSGLFTTTHGTLLARISDASDPAAWSEFCAQYEEMIRAFARRQGMVGSDADDVVQEVLLALTKALPGFEYDPAKGKFRSYLKTVVVRGIIRKRERQAGEARTLDLNEESRVAAADATLDDVWEEEWRQQHLRRAMRKTEAEFSNTDVRCFRAYVLEGADAEEVAKRFNVSVGQIYNAKHRILARLRETIAAQIEDEG